MIFAFGKYRANLKMFRMENEDVKAIPEEETIQQQSGTAPDIPIFRFIISTINADQ